MDNYGYMAKLMLTISCTKRYVSLCVGPHVQGYNCNVAMPEKRDTNLMYPGKVMHVVVLITLKHCMVVYSYIVATYSHRL